MSDRHEDARGVIQDWLGPLDSVTHITTKKDAVRGNHVHHKTTQWTLVLKGRLLMASGATRHEVGPLECCVHNPGDPHAWRALEDTDCLVFTKGPRSGEQYESDTYRLEEPLLT
jgi:quercetin dioxygenase-like cupin family protein